ncbi:cation transporter [bacterium]|nr:cation transporter [bacterium]
MNNEQLLRRALILSVITIVYNVIEGLVSVYFGYADETLALFGFGADSFVEVISGLGILHMIMRMKRAPVMQRDSFERTALRVTGVSFYLLTAGLLAGVVLNIIQDVKPETTLVGIIISSLSILTMYGLMKAKLSVGKALNSDAIIADANCTRTCFYLSIILLASSGLYELFGIAWFDLLGSLGIAYFAFSEGREAFEKASSETLACSCEH